MSRHRSDILEWITQGRIPSAALPAALRVAGVTPGREDWRRFFDQLTLWLGAVFCAAAVVFFFAYNWQAMGRFAKFGLIEMLLLAAVAASVRLGLGPDRASGKAALLAAALLVGGLLALVGQTYQTGADPYELFAVWALAILPWVALARFGTFWLFWIGLLNLAVALYYQAFGGLFGFLFGVERLLWALFALNAAALALWEWAAQRGIAWLGERWPLRILAAAAGALVTILAVWATFDKPGDKPASFALYLLWMAALYAVYRRRLPDLFTLAGMVLSGVVFGAALLSKLLFGNGGLGNDSGAFLMVGLAVIGMSAAGGLWLKSVAREERS